MRYEVDGHGVATVWLDRPERNNSWTGRMPTDEDLLRTDAAASVEDSKHHIGRLMQHADYAEGVAAFIDKREPRFTDHLPAKKT